MNQTPDQLHADLMADTVAFPLLSAAELEECAEFGTRCSFGAGEDLFRAGAHPFDCYVILSGEVCIIDVSTDEPTYLIRLRGGNSRVTLICSLGDARPPPARLSPRWKLSASRPIKSVRCWCASRPWARVFGEHFNAAASC